MLPQLRQEPACKSIRWVTSVINTSWYNLRPSQASSSKGKHRLLAASRRQDVCRINKKTENTDFGFSSPIGDGKQENSEMLNILCEEKSCLQPSACSYKGPQPCFISLPGGEHLEQAAVKDGRVLLHFKYRSGWECFWIDVVFVLQWKGDTSRRIQNVHLQSADTTFCCVHTLSHFLLNHEFMMFKA